MNLYEKSNLQIPDYYDTMYLDGFTPEEILMAKRKQMNEALLDEEDEVIITFEGGPKK
ncbi:MAG: hypothetical protein K6E83_00975 [Clostridium sp.]|nr:hypothetical protein [Clostridium sp.]